MVEKLLLALLFLISSICNVDAYSCKGLNGKSVDWFVAYKLPKYKDGNSSLTNGAIFYYADAKSQQWQLSDKRVDDKNSAIGQTVSQLFAAKQKSTDFYASYNDENPNNPKAKYDFNRGHTKGLVVSDDIEGFWLVHSVPKFVRTNGTTSYSFPSNGYLYGQSFICVTLSSAELNQIGTQLLFNQVQVYDFQIPPSYSRLYPNLDQAVRGKEITGQIYYSIANLTTSGGLRFISFAKHKKFGKDLYSKLVAPTLKSSFFMEGWVHAFKNGTNLPTDCTTPYKVYNLKSVQIGDYKFDTYEDHAKWVTSVVANDGWICIGDINRQNGQKFRGGGTLCMKNPQIWKIYRDAATSLECCPTNNSYRPRIAGTSNTIDPC